jgi:hypothetical protein
LDIENKKKKNRRKGSPYHIFLVADNQWGRGEGDYKANWFALDSGKE